MRNNHFRRCERRQRAPKLTPTTTSSRLRRPYSFSTMLQSGRSSRRNSHSWLLQVLRWWPVRPARDRNARSGAERTGHHRSTCNSHECEFLLLLLPLCSIVEKL